MISPTRIVPCSFLLLVVSVGCGGRLQNVDGADAGAAPDAAVAQLCGDPGRDCQGGACVLGECQPVTLASGPEFANIAWLTVDATNVYCAGYNSGTVSKIPVRGGAVTVLASGISYPQGIVADATHVYWASAVMGSWGKVPIAGGPATQLGPVGASGGALALNGSTLLASVATGGIDLLDVDGSSPQSWWSGAVVHGIDTDGTNAYWVELTSESIVQRSLAGGDPMTLATGQSLAFDGVRAFNGNVYWSTGWTESEHGSIRSVPVGGGPVKILATGDVYPETIAVDSSGVYWTNPVKHQVMRLAPNATTPEIVARGQLGAYGLALDDASVYWTVDIDDTTGALMRGLK